MTTEFAGKLAWVTGAGSGIGRAIAVALAQAGMTVALSGRREAPLRETAELCGRGDTLVLPLNVTNFDEVEVAATVLRSSPGGPDVLINSAGVNIARRHAHQLDTAAIDMMMQVNLTAPFVTTVAVLPAMRARGGGLIVQISSMAGQQVSLFAGPAYTAAKTGLVALSAAINQEQGIHNIRSTCLCPGEVATPIMDLRAVPPTPEERSRMLQAEDLAEMVLFVTRLPARICVNEVLVTPTVNRIAAQAEAVSRLI